MRRPLLVLAIGCWPLAAANYLRIDADGQRYTLDTDQTAVRRALRPISQSKALAKLPAWLLPGPGAEASEVHYDVASGVVSAIFPCAAAETDVSSYYLQVLRAHGFGVSTLPTATGRQITGSTPTITITVTTATNARSGIVTARANYAPHQPPSNLRFQAVWYDDSAGILRLRDANTGDEYDMDKQAILECSLNRPGGVESKGAGMPSWLPVYPGAFHSPKGQVTWLMTPTAEFLTNDSVKQVYDFYVDAVTAAGARITERGSQRDGKTHKEESARIVAFNGADKVEIHIGDVMWTSMGLTSTRPNAHTGIAIRYSVPLQ
jgi:hypothetical protein